MKSKRHLETRFLEFIVERRKQLEKEKDEEREQREDIEQIDIQTVEEQDDKDELDPEDTSDEQILERLSKKYKRLRDEYENILREKSR